MEVAGVLPKGRTAHREDEPFATWAILGILYDEWVG